MNREALRLRVNDTAAGTARAAARGKTPDVCYGVREFSLWQGGRGMRITTKALGTALVLCNLGTLSAAAHAQKAKVNRELVRVPIVTTTPYWDYNIVPRYRYRPQDDRVDPYGPPVAPVIRYGNQEVYIHKMVAEMGTVICK